MLTHGTDSAIASQEHPEGAPALLAVLTRPDDLEARVALGDALREAGDLAAAIAQYEIAAECAPDDFRIILRLAAALSAVGLFDEAAARCRVALERDRAHPGISAMLEQLSARPAPADVAERRDTARQVLEEAQGLERAGQLARALAAFARVAQQVPGIAPVHYRIGCLLQDLGQPERALSQYELATRLDPRLFAAAHNAGKLAAGFGLVDRAKRHLKRADRLRPGDGLSMRLALLTESIHQSKAAIAESRARFEQGLDRLLEAPPRIDDPLNKADLPTFYLAYHGLCNRELHSKLARLFPLATPDLRFDAPHCLRSSRRPGRIRIGFISRFMRTHSIGKVARGLIAGLNREHFEVYVLNIPPVVRDATSVWIEAHCDRSLTLADTLVAARAEIAALELDILFYQDIGMEVFSYLLAHSRLAKAQCVSYGHPDTTGIPTIDYYISNDLYEPPGASTHYSERLVELHDLPTLAYYYRPQAPEGPLPVRDDLGLPHGARLYVCPQTLFKLHPDFDGLMHRILQLDGAARIVLFAGDCTEWTRLLQRRFRTTMGDCTDRIQFIPRQPYPRFLQVLRTADVVIDTLHFNGMNTSIDAFSVGTPVVTLPTALQRGRFTQAMYRTMGIGDGVASNADEYACMAVEIARNADRHATLRQLIDERSGRLFEDGRAIGEFERFFLAAHLESLDRGPA